MQPASQPASQPSQGFGGKENKGKESNIMLRVLTIMLMIIIVVVIMIRMIIAKYNSRVMD